MKNHQTGAARQTSALPTAGKLSKKISMLSCMVALAALSVLSSCKKDTEDSAVPTLKTTSGIALAPSAGGPALSLSNVTTGTVSQSASDSVYSMVNYYVAQSVYNPANPHQANGLYYFDFSLNDNVLGSSSTTPPDDDWDISFSGTGNADIKANTAGGVAVKFLNETFAVATARSSASAWSAGTAAAATFGHNRTVTTLTSADYLAAASGHTIKGWWNYYFTNHTVLATTDLTILVKDASGDVYAVHMQSVYNNQSPSGIPFPSNFSYLTYEYKKL